MTKDNFKIRPDIMRAMNAYAARGMTGDNPDTGLWLIPEGSAKDFIRSGFMPPGIEAPSPAEIIGRDLSSDEIAEEQSKRAVILREAGL